MPIKKIIFLSIASISLLASCTDISHDLLKEKLIMKIMADELNQDRYGEIVFINNLLSYDDIDRPFYGIFSEDGSFKPSVLKGKFDSLTALLLETKRSDLVNQLAGYKLETIKELAPSLNLTDSIKILEGNQEEIIDDYIESKGSRDFICHISLSRPIIVKNKFAFVYDQYFCDGNHTGTEIKIYYFDGKQWEYIGGNLDWVT